MVLSRIAAVVAAFASEHVARGAQLSLEVRIDRGECWGTELSDGQTYFPDNVQAKSDASLAQLFSILYSDNFKVVTSKMAKEQYVLTQCGQPQPTDAQVTAVAPLESGYMRKYFTVPLQSAVALSTVQLAFLAALDVQDRILHVDQYATGPCWQKAIKCGSVLENADSNSTHHEWQKSSVDAVFMDCGSDCSKVSAQQNGVHVPTAHDSDLLATAEYVKYMGAFFNKEPLANELFAKAKRSYEQAASGAQGNLVVAWINFQNWGEPEFIVSQATYKLRLTTAAGGSNLDVASALANVPGLRVTDAVASNPAAGKTYTVNVSAYADKAAASARFFAALTNVDIVVDEVYAWNPSDYNFDSFLDAYGLDASSSLKFVQNKMVLRFDRTISESKGLDWYESRIAHPDLAVDGLARVLHGDTTKAAKYFRNVAKDETVDQIVSAQDCSKALPVCSADADPETISISGPVDVEVSAAWAYVLSAPCLLLASFVAVN